VKPADLTYFQNLHAVVLAVPDYFQSFSGLQRETKLSDLARKALSCSAQLSGVADMVFEKNWNGSPKPVNGVYWSLSHTDGYVAAITAPHPIGIDIEKIDAFSAALKRSIARDKEWKLAKTLTPITFFSFWTAKEAVLKAEGIGLKGLPDCRIVAVEKTNHIILEYKSSRWSVENRILSDGYLVSLTSAGVPVIWHRK